MSKNRNYCFTSYLAELNPKDYNYIVWGIETCPTTGNHHLQGYAEFASQIVFSSAQKRIGDPKCHIETRKGTAKDASDYCKKGSQSHDEWHKEGIDGPNYGLNAIFFEFGEMTNQGARTDLALIKDRVFKERSSISSLLKEDLIQNHQQLKFAEALQKYQPFKEREPPEVYWYYGETGCGKTRKVYDREGFDIFRMEGEFKWFDGYDGHEVAFLDELRGQMTLSLLLQVLDRYEVRLPTKGGFIIWHPKRIYITSSKSPEECYKNCGENIGQLNRRITHQEFFG